MAWAPDYCTTAELKSHLRITDTADDADLAIAITAASRAVDHACNRQFGQASPAVARYYAWGRGYLDLSSRQVLEIDDLMTSTSLVVKVDDDDDGTFETTLTITTDFLLHPFNAAADGRPWTGLVLDPDAAVVFSTRPRAVEITALWGWSSVPTIVKQATLIQAARFFQRRNSPYGVAGSPDMGSEMRLLARVDPDVAVMLSTVKRHWLAV